MKIALASDHAGREYRKAIGADLASQGFSVIDLGVPDGVESADYPDYALKAAEAVASGACDRGVLICGTGTGMAMAANKVKGVRAANCTGELMARLARRHNDANVLALGSRLLGLELALAIVEAFLTTGFDGGRHQARLAKLQG
ncbi:MAG: ribose 5-phosphate isomerase B [Candidatus Adiutrix sp.]|nr:ribose 5-phosphate isomerase B [Candidatus Adiutrix sp.]